MENIYLTYGSKDFLKTLQSKHSDRHLYLMAPVTRDQDKNNYQLMEITSKPSIFATPVTYSIKHESVEKQIQDYNHYMFFNFGLDENLNHWHQLERFFADTDALDHTAFLATHAGPRVQYLFYTSWESRAVIDKWRAMTDYQRLDQLKDTSAQDWSFYETSYQLDKK